MDKLQRIKSLPITLGSDLEKASSLQAFLFFSALKAF
jgi:hypothetical protein